MERCDVLIVGGGPAGSSCARGLRGSGLDVLILDRAVFPRDKPCAGWITPPVCDSLELDLDDYRRGRVLQPIVGFAVGWDGDPYTDVDFGRPISYGIRRFEFDRYLLERSGARLRLGEPLLDLRREAGRYVVNGEIEARHVVGAGGHFCPVARWLGARPGAAEPTTVVAREIEFEMTPAQRAACRTRPQVPELQFEADLRGYGWVVRKGNWLNVGLGRQDSRRFPDRVAGFLDELAGRGRIPPGTPTAGRGHAYLLYDEAPRPVARDDALLVGDAAGLAYPRSGEGIRTAIESGLLAAQVLRAAPGDAARRYAGALRRRFGKRHGRRRAGPSDWLPRRWRGPAVARLLATPWFAREVVVGRWFLHRERPPLRVPSVQAG